MPTTFIVFAEIYSTRHWWCPSRSTIGTPKAVQVHINRGPSWTLLEEPGELTGDGTNGILGLACASMCILLVQLYHRHHNDIHLMPAVLIFACNRTRSSQAQSRKALRTSTVSRSSSRTMAVYISDTSTTDHSGAIEYHSLSGHVSCLRRGTSLGPPEYL